MATDIDIFRGVPLYPEEYAPANDKEKAYEQVEIAKIHLSIFGAFVVPPNKEHYNDQNQRTTTMPYEPTMQINTKAYTRDSMGSVFNFPVELEDSLDENKTPSNLRSDYLLYKEHVLQLFRTGCKIQDPQTTMNICSKGERGGALWSSIKATVVLATPRPQIFRQNTHRNQEVVRVSLQAAPVTKDTPHPNQLSSHRRVQAISTGSLFLAPPLTRFEDRKLKTFYSRRDISIFGTYMVPPTPQNIKQSRSIDFDFPLEINRKCLRACDFETPLYLTTQESLKSLQASPDKRKDLKFRMDEYLREAMSFALNGAAVSNYSSEGSVFISCHLTPSWIKTQHPELYAPYDTTDSLKSSSCPSSSDSE